jgi:sulfite exporter TauE/SafE
VVKKVLTLIMALGLVVAFTGVAMAGMCGGPKITLTQANADPTNTQQNDQIVVAQAEMTEDTSPVEGTDEEKTDDENTSN